MDSPWIWSTVILVLLFIIFAWVLRGSMDREESHEREAENRRKASKTEQTIREMTPEERKKLWEKLKNS